MSSDRGTLTRAGTGPAALPGDGRRRRRSGRAPGIWGLVAAIALAGPGVAGALEPAPFLLPAQGGVCQLRFHTNASAPGFTRLELEAHGEVLLGSGDGSGLRITPTGSQPVTRQPLVFLGHRAGADWEYAAFDLTPLWGDRVSRGVRHLLFVEPDLFVICDEFKAVHPEAWEVSLSSPGPLQFEAVSGNVGMTRSRAGLTGHVLVHPYRILSPWTTNREERAGVSLITRSTRAVSEFRSIAVLLPHAAGAKRGTGFRMIVTDTAIGARIHRDGLPTLVAFNLTREGDAELAGLRFRGPVAVDVFRPKPRTR